MKHHSRQLKTGSRGRIYKAEQSHNKDCRGTAVGLKILLVIDINSSQCARAEREKKSED